MTLTTHNTNAQTYSEHSANTTAERSKSSSTTHDGIEQPQHKKQKRGTIQQNAQRKTIRHNDSENTRRRRRKQHAAATENNTPQRQNTQR